MRVSALTPGGDWQFGKGRALYLRRSDAIRQSVVTRLRSFTNDWFLDVTAGIDWIGLLGQKGTQRRIERAIERTVLATQGVKSIERLEVTGPDDQRKLTVNLAYTDIFDQRTNETVSLP